MSDALAFLWWIIGLWLIVVLAAVLLGIVIMLSPLILLGWYVALATDKAKPGGNQA